MTDYGDDGDGLLMKALRTGSGYYIDVGCSELIASGQVKVRSGVEIERLTATSAVLTDGTKLPADAIIYATGYRPMNEWVASIISRETADLIGPNWGYGSGSRGDPGPWLGRAPQHVEANETGGSLVSWRKPPFVTALLEAGCPSAQGANGRNCDTGLLRPQHHGCRVISWFKTQVSLTMRVARFNGTNLLYHITHAPYLGANINQGRFRIESIVVDCPEEAVCTKKNRLRIS